MFNPIQGCNDLIKSLTIAIGSYQDAMFLYLTILMSENVQIGIREKLYDFESVSQDFNIIGVLTPKDSNIIEVYILNSRSTFSSGSPSAGVSSEMNSDHDLFISTYQKDERGQWQVIKKRGISGKPSKETIWKKY